MTLHPIPRAAPAVRGLGAMGKPIANAPPLRRRAAPSKLRGVWPTVSPDPVGRVHSPAMTVATGTAREDMAPGRADAHLHPSHGSAPDDAALLARAGDGDEDALGLLYDRHAARAYGLALAMLKDADEAQEVVADAFAQAWRTAARFEPARGEVAGWILTIARSRALDRMRTRRRHLKLMEQSAAGEDDGLALPLAGVAATSDAAEHDDVRAAVARSLAALPDAQRSVIELAYFRGLSQSEIAEALGAPLGTVKTRMRAAMEKLRDTLAPHAPEARS